MAAVVELQGLRRDHHMGDAVVHALRGVDLRVEAGEMVAILGPSGSGKSTLMNTLGCLDTPTGGVYLLDGKRVDRLSDDARADIRNHNIGFVFQGFNLLSRMSAVENVALPLLYDRAGRFPHPEQAAAEALRRVGLGQRLDHPPEALSGGQQQRVAIARALVTRPTLLLADEPTGNLDTHTTIEIMALFQELHRAGLTLILVTHEDEVAHYCTRAITLRDGQIISDHRQDPRDASADLAALGSEP
jgi:putative ABC transport system ATP-binding protein